MTNYHKQVATSGKIFPEIQQDAQTHIIDFCSINDNYKLLQGNLYNVGFYPKLINPSEYIRDYNALATDMDFLQNCINVLNDAAAPTGGLMMQQAITIHL